MKCSMMIVFILMMAGLCFARDIPQNMKVRNLTAFTRMWGCVKHWYPSDEAQDIDWDRFAVYGSRKVISSSDTGELKQTLSELFSPIVPGLELFTDARPEPGLPAENPSLMRTFWQYEGYNNTQASDVYKSIRTNRPYKIAKNKDSQFNWASLFPQIPQLGVQDSKLRVSFRLKQAEGDALTTAIYLGYGNSNANASDSLRGAAWVEKSYILEGIEVAGEQLWLVFMSFDWLYLDDLRVETWQDGAWQQVFESDFSEDKAGNLPAKLSVSLSPLNSGIVENVDALVEELEGNKVLAIRKSVSEKPYTLGIIDRIFPAEPAPNELLEKQLAPGLNCRFPLVLSCDMANTYPIPDPVKLEDLRQAYSVTDLHDRSDLHVWLAGVVKYWNELNFFYPYFEYNLCDWEKELPLCLDRVLRCKDFAQYKQALLLLMSQTRDGHAFLSDQSHNSKMPKFNTYPIDGKWIVSKVLDQSLGIPEGSYVTHMNGKDFAKLMRENRPYFIAANAETTDLRLFGRYMKTYPDSVATFSFITPDKRKISQKMVLEEYEGWKWVVPEDKLVKYPDGIVYVNANAITDRELQDAMPDLLAARGLILDLRYYPRISTNLIGQLLSEPDTLSNTLIKRYIRPNEELPGKDDGRPTWWLKPAEPHIGAKVLALSSRNSQSYCEQYLAVLKHNQLATLVGQATAGANGNVITTQLPGDLIAYWTGMLVRNHDKSRFLGVGIIPDILVKRTWDDIVKGRDPELDKALEVLRSSREDRADMPETGG